MDDFDKLKELSEDYNISLTRIKSYYELLKKIPFVEDYGNDLLIQCVEEIVQDMNTNEFKIQEMKRNGTENLIKMKSLKYSISDALYRTYGDEAVPYLDKEYIEENKNRYSFYNEYYSLCNFTSVCTFKLCIFGNYLSN